MPYPTAALATLRPDLGDSLLDFDLDSQQAGSIAIRVLPVIETIKQAGPWGRITLAEILKKRDVSPRAPGDEYGRGGFAFTADTFATLDYGLEFPVDQRNKTMYEEYFDLELLSAQLARAAVMEAAEKRAAALLFDTAVFTGAQTSAATAKWDVKATAVPREDVKRAKLAVRNACGMVPNALIMSFEQFEHVIDSDSIVERLKHSGHVNPSPETINTTILAQALNIQMVIVAGMVKNTKGDGATPVIADVWDKTLAMVAKVGLTNRITEPCVGRTFHWGEDGSSVGGVMESYAAPNRRSEFVRARHDVEERLIIKECAHLLTVVL